MAEKGIRVQGDEAGFSVSFYDAVVEDQDSVSRVIQLVDQSQRKHEFNVSTEDGLIRTKDNSAADSTVLTTVPSDIITNALLIEDKTTLVVACHYYLSEVYNITLTPIILDSDNAAIGTLKPKIICTYKPSGGTAITDGFHKVDGTSNNWNIAEMMSWNVLGGYKVGIHIASASSTGLLYGSLKIFAKMITGPETDGYAATRNTAGSYVDMLTGTGGP